MADPGAFDRPELAPLWTELRRRFEVGGPVRTVRMAGLQLEQRAALADLLGLARLPAERLTIPVSKLDDALYRVLGHGARDLVEALSGPLRDRAGERTAATNRREQLWAELAGQPVVRAQPALRGWVAGLRRTGLIDGSVPATRAHAEQALAVLAALPGDGEPLPALADRVLGDPHGLDDDTRLAGTVLRALAALHDEPVPADAQRRRQLWALHGVAADELSATVLVAGLAPPGSGALATTLRTWAGAGQAAVVTLAQLRGATELAVGPVVHVVENPSVPAMAVRRFGAACPPLVCPSGWPSTAAILLLRTLRCAGSELRYHGDLDGEGLRIAAYAIDKAGAVPWRMSTVDYVDAAGDRGPPVGRVTEAPWDPELASALAHRGVSVPEERVASLLLDDLELLRR